MSDIFHCPVCGLPVSQAINGTSLAESVTCANGHTVRQYFPDAGASYFRCAVCRKKVTYDQFDDYPQTLSYPFLHQSTFAAKVTAIMDAAKQTSTDGSATELWPPGGAYTEIWTRDQAMMMQGVPSYFSAAQIAGAFNFIASRVGATNKWVPDHIALDGTVYWYPGPGPAWGARSPVDGGPFLVEIAYQHFLKTGAATLYSANAALLRAVLDTIPANPTTCCVAIPDDNTGFVGWGFIDSVKPSGDVLFPSILLFRAYQELAAMADANNDTTTADYAILTANNIRTGIQATLWNASTGLFKTATGDCSGQDDVWGSALAVYYGVSTSEQTAAIGNALVAGLVDYYYEGGIRQSPISQDEDAGVHCWETYFSDSVTWGTYQNGAYWPTPLPWVVYAISKVNLPFAESMIADFWQRCADDGVDYPLEWFSSTLPNVGAVNYAANACLEAAMLALPSDLAPVNVDDCICWFDASQIAGFSDGDPIEFLGDLSGSNTLAIQRTANKQPIYKTGIINSLPVVRFDGSNDEMFLMPFALSSGWSIFVVAKINTIVDGCIIGKQEGGAHGPEWSLSIISHQLACNMGADTTYTWAHTTTPIDDNTARLLGGLWDGSYLYVRNNGVSVSAEATEYVTNACLVALGSQDGSCYTPMDLGELIIFNRCVSSEERTTIENYLAAKWGITI